MAYPGSHTKKASLILNLHSVAQLAFQARDHMGWNSCPVSGNEIVDFSFAQK